MTDSDSRPDTTSASGSDEPAAFRPDFAEPSLRRVPVWLPVASALLLAVVAMSFALLGGQGPAGRGASGSSSSGSLSASSTATSTVPAPPLTVADVEVVLGEIDYVESSDSSMTTFDNAVARMLRGIDLLAFANSTLDATPAIAWTDVGAAQARQVAGDEKAGLIAEQQTYWLKLRDSSGSDQQPLADMLAEAFYPPTPPDRNRSDSLLQVTAQGLEPLRLMFGARNVDSGWTWRVVDVSIVGTSAADVTYVASVLPRSGWGFADPAVRYTKQLRFAYGDDKRWRLSGWTNYPAVLAKFRRNVTPASAVPRTDDWWGAM